MIHSWCTVDVVCSVNAISIKVRFDGGNGGISQRYTYQVKTLVSAAA